MADDEPQPKRSRESESNEKEEKEEKEENPLPKGWEKRMSRSTGKILLN